MRPESAGIVARFLVVWRTDGGGRSAVCSGGPCLLDSGGLSKPACGETQEEQLGVSRGICSDLEFAGTSFRDSDQY